jgi:hypothetical protein
MASKSKAQRAFLIKVVADSEFAKSRKMSQDVARDILEQDEEHIAKDKHWADKLPDRAGGHSMESRDVWYNPEFIELIVDQQVHPSFESLTDKFKSMFNAALGRKPTGPSGSSKTEDKPNYDMLFSHSPESSRKPKEGTADFSALATKLRMKPVSGPFWNGLIKNLDDYIRTTFKMQKDVVEYCKKCEKVYKKCETLQPMEARAYAEAQMRNINNSSPKKPELPLADFELTTGPHGGMSHVMQMGSPQHVVCEYPTQAQLDKLISLTGKLFMGVDEGMDDGYWTLDDTDEIKWWDHHFPGQSSAWGPMLNLFPFAGEVRGYDSTAMERSAHAVTVAMIHLIEATSVLKSE